MRLLSEEIAAERTGRKSRFVDIRFRLGRKNGVCISNATAVIRHSKTRSFFSSARIHSFDYTFISFLRSYVVRKSDLYFHFTRISSKKHAMYGEHPWRNECWNNILVLCTVENSCVLFLHVCFSLVVVHLARWFLFIAPRCSESRVAIGANHSIYENYTARTLTHGDALNATLMSIQIDLYDIFLECSKRHYCVFF